MNKKIKTTVKDWDFDGYNTAHQCHENSYKYCLDNEGCKFVVGVIKKSDIPHCIVKLPNGEYIDPTLNREMEFIVNEEYETQDIIKIFAIEGMYFIPNEPTFINGELIKYDGLERVVIDKVEVESKELYFGNSRVNDNMKNIVMLASSFESIIGNINKEYNELLEDYYEASDSLNTLVTSIEDIDAITFDLSDKEDIDNDDLSILLESADYIWNDLSNFEFEVQNIDLDRKDNILSEISNAESKLNELREEINKMLRMRSILLSK